MLSGTAVLVKGPPAIITLGQGCSHEANSRHLPTAIHAGKAPSSSSSASGSSSQIDAPQHSNVASTGVEEL